MLFFTFRNLYPILLAGILFLACDKKEDSKLPPVVNLKTGSHYTQNGDTVMIGRPIQFGIQARASDAVITNLTITKILSDQSYTVVMDTGCYAQSLDLERVYYQNFENEVAWTVRIMDKNRQTAETHFTVYKDPNSQFGGIIHYPSITMGYQNNTTHYQFYDIEEDSLHSEASASQTPENIDIITYFIMDEGLPSPVFSSPGEYDHNSDEAGTYYPSIIDWEQRNYLLWDISVDDNPIDAKAFDNCHNDSMLIAGYHDVWGKKKFKWVTEGRVIPFQAPGERKGLIKVLRADHDETGSIEFALKMQL